MDRAKKENHDISVTNSDYAYKNVNAAAHYLQHSRYPFLYHSCMPSTNRSLQLHREVVMLKGISDTNTEEQILRSIDVLKDVVLSTRNDVKEVNQRLDRVEADVGEIRNEIKEVRNDIGEIKETLREISGRG